MFDMDAARDKDGGVIYKVKSNFNMPLKKDRQGNYKVKSGETLRLCMTSDFFIEEADKWRPEVWQMMRQRPDVGFYLLTKRAEHIEKCLPEDWGEGYDNVSLNITAENQQRADERFPILLGLKAKHRGVMAAPLIGAIDMEKYLATGKIESVFADGERRHYAMPPKGQPYPEKYSTEGVRPLHYEWVKSLHDQCERQGVPFSFFGTGTLFVKDGKTYHICRAYQQVQALRSGLWYPPVDTRVKIQKRCADCVRRELCNGCRNCGRC